MDLILWRHAEAEDARTGQDDLARCLTPKGEQQAERLARWFKRRLPAGTLILASPARRTQQTAAAFGRSFATSPALAPGCSVESLLTAAGWPDGDASVLVVGHQPTLGLTAAWLLARRQEAWPLRKAGAIWLRSRDRGAAQQVVLHAVTGPDLV